eukprot:Amastigsp_a531_208.p1 type:complete len:233 gc:universal Amastigsp_a531_208:80-778(+)
MSWQRDDEDDEYNAVDDEMHDGAPDDAADELIGMMVGMGNLVSDADKLRAFQSVCGFDEAQARFYLDASSWNVDIAVSSFFANAERAAEPELLAFHCTNLDIDAPRLEGLEPGQELMHTWNLRNTGLAPWPAGTYVSWVDGETFGADSVIQLEREVAPSEDIPLTVALRVPEHVDSLSIFGRWRMFLPDHTAFGDPIQVIVAFGPPHHVEFDLRHAGGHGSGHRADDGPVPM